MDGALKGLFGGGTDAASTAAGHDFVQRVTTGDQSQGYTDAEAHAAVQHVMQNASPDVLNSALQQSVNNLSGDQKTQFATMLQQRADQGRPADTSGGPSIQRTSDAGVQAASTSGSSSGGNAVTDILGSILGGSGGGLLGSLLGGGASPAQANPGAVLQQAQPGAASTSAASTGGGMFGSVGELMGNPIGKMVMAGMAAFAMKEILHK